MEKRIKKFDDMLSQQKQFVDLDKLRELSWLGIPSNTPHYRCQIWKLLLDYLPTDQEMQRETIGRKRGEYKDMVMHYFEKVQYLSVAEVKSVGEMSAYEKKSMKQIQIDVYRTQPDLKLFSTSYIQVMMIRILFIWSMRHPASGYVQGINDLAAPLILVFLTEYVNELNENNIYDIQEKDLEELEEEALLSAEADVFWSLSKLIDDIQDNYTDL